MLEAQVTGLKGLAGRLCRSRHIFRTAALVAIVLAPLLGAPSARGQEDFAPLDLPRRAVSGSFGEYRPTHLHAGIDFATFGRTGIPVRAIADGRVYRVRSSAGGYGNVVYLRHDDGRRSVYAHLERFAPEIAALLPRRPHELGGDAEGGSMEVYPTRTVRVRRGDVIAWSGESGSGLPHLHLEVRDAEDRPVHPVRSGLVTVRDRVPPRIDYVVIEPADPASSINGGGSPWRIDSTVRDAAVTVNGRCRILVSAFDHDGQLGGTLAPRLLEMTVDEASWSRIEMAAFTYGRDREWADVYDAYRTGYGPTAYVFDLTGRDGAAEVLRSRGAVSAPTGEARIALRVEDMAGLAASFGFRLVADPAGARGGFRVTGQHGEHIDRGGLSVVRNGQESRFRGPGGGQASDGRWSAAAADGRGDRPVLLIDRVRIAGVPRGLEVIAFEGASIPAPPQAVGPVLLLGPLGAPLERNATVSVTGIGEANGLARYRNGTWSWLGGSRQGDLIASRLDHLLPIVPVRDTVPPEIGWDVETRRGRRTAIVRIEDDFSGVDPEQIEVVKVVEDRRIPVRGRFDRDRDRFLPADRLRSGERLVVRAVDDAGNAATRSLTVP